MGWPVDIEELTANQAVTMSKSTLDGGTAYKIVNPNNSNEYFMLEKIKKMVGTSISVVKDCLFIMSIVHLGICH